MGPRTLVYGIVSVLAGIALLVGGGGAWTAYEYSQLASATSARIVILAVLAGLLLTVAVSVAWWLLESRLVRPLQRLARDIHTVAHSSANASITLPQPHALGEIATTTAELAERMVRMRRETVQVMGTAAAQVERQSSLLEAVVLDLDESVIVCGFDHRVLTYNYAAVRFVDKPVRLDRFVAGKGPEGRYKWRIRSWWWTTNPISLLLSSS